jgi:hypothetical protein
MDGYSLHRPGPKKAKPWDCSGARLTDSPGEKAEGVEKHGVAEDYGPIREHPLEGQNFADGIAEGEVFAVSSDANASRKRCMLDT